MIYCGKPQTPQRDVATQTTTSQTLGMWLCHVSRLCLLLLPPWRVKAEMWSFWEHNLMLTSEQKKLHSSEKRSVSENLAIRAQSRLVEKQFLFYRFSHLLMFYCHLSNLHMCGLCLTRGLKISPSHVFQHENIQLCRNDSKSKYNISSVKVQLCVRVSQNSLFVRYVYKFGGRK